MIITEKNTAIDPSDFEYVCSFVRERAGIVLEEGKQYLVESRLSQLVEREGYPSVQHLLTSLRNCAGRELHEKVVEAMCTNETYFFRDVHPFEVIKRKVLPRLLERRSHGDPLVIWSAACSTGQEPYSLAMMLREHFPHLVEGQVRILASDISGNVLEKAAAGLYNQIEINRGLPAPLLVKYFSKRVDRWVISEKIRSMVEFLELNLNGTWPPLPRVDLILMRNVMIYFDVPTKRQILEKVRQQLNPQGALFLGSSETTLMIDDCFHSVDHGTCHHYQLQKPKTEEN